MCGDATRCIASRPYERDVCCMLLLSLGFGMRAHAVRVVVGVYFFPIVDGFESNNLEPNRNADKRLPHIRTRLFDYMRQFICIIYALCQGVWAASRLVCVSSRTEARVR